MAGSSPAWSRSRSTSTVAHARVAADRSWCGTPASSSCRRSVRRSCDTPPAFARFDAVVFIRTSCADIARPATWKIAHAVGSPCGYSPFSARVTCEMRPFRNDERRLILDRVLGEGGLFGRLSSTVLPSIEVWVGTRYLVCGGDIVVARSCSTADERLAEIHVARLEARASMRWRCSRRARPCAANAPPARHREPRTAYPLVTGSFSRAVSLHGNHLRRNGIDATRVPVCFRQGGNCRDAGRSSSGAASGCRSAARILRGRRQANADCRLPFVRSGRSGRRRHQTGPPLA